MEENSEIQEDLGNGGKFKNWLQDNIRIILSVLIVATIAAGIYSYSKRTVVPVDQIDNTAEVNLVEANKNDNDNKTNNAVVVVGDDEDANKTENVDDDSKKLSVKEEDKSADVNKKEEKVVVTQEEEKVVVEEKKAEEPKKEEKPVVEEKKEEKQSVASGEETETSFVEVANNGDSLTTLARQATKQYLEKNPVDGLTKEHKVYIEDYLRKHIDHSATIRSGEQVSFSKGLIKTAIEASKNLNERQLENLQKYSARVSNL